MSEKMHRPSPESNSQELNRSTPSQEDAAKILPKKTHAEIEEADKGNGGIRDGVEAPIESEENNSGNNKSEKK